MNTKTLTGAVCLWAAAVIAAGASAAEKTDECGKKAPDHTPEVIKQMQADFLKLKFGMFIHYNMATYTGEQWVTGYPDPSTFNPGGPVDTDAWADAAKAAGMKYAVLTAKHVAGFCLWDSKYTTYDVMNPKCPYQQDLVAQFIKSFKSRGLKVGLYYHWRHPRFGDPNKHKVLPPECDPATHSLDEQKEFQLKQIAELLEKYPDCFYFWNDAYDPAIGTAEEVLNLERSVRPNILASSNWWKWGRKGTPYLDIAVKELGHFPEGNQAPGETCFSLAGRKWFWDSSIRGYGSARDVVNKLQTANARNSNLLLNVPPNKQGRLDDAAVKVLAEVGKLLNPDATGTPSLSPANSRAAKKDKPIKVFVLVGDENILEQGVISGTKPGTLETVVAQNPKYAFLKSKDGKWVTRNDVVVYDLNPLLNNTVAIGHYLQVGDVPYGGRQARQRMGVELMYGTVMGEHFDQPVLLVRYANNRTMSASLGRNYLPPSSGGAGKITGGWDVIHFNWGVWDAMYHDKSSKYCQGHGNTTAVADYEQNLRTLVARLKQTGATLIFANTTPVWEGEPGRPNGDVQAFNRVARKVMEENGVIYEDLNAEVRRQGQGKTHNVHDVGHLGPKVVEGLLKALAERKNKSQPLPRVLLIGDSITGGYKKAVMGALDGKAAFYMQPGNAESTWTGLQRIDEWLDLKRYVRSGDDYMNLVDGLRSAFKNLDRVYPDYAGQGAELAGLVWFQGLADATSSSMTAAYQTNLVNLIKDLRKDLDAPHLPVVVAALCPSPKGLRYVTPPNLKTIFNAQMAVGDPKQYPEFAGNVISLDTSSDLNPPELCPEGLPSPTTFGGNAESYLKLGEQMANALLQLMEAEGNNREGLTPSDSVTVDVVQPEQDRNTTKGNPK